MTSSDRVEVRAII